LLLASTLVGLMTSGVAFAQNIPVTANGKTQPASGGYTVTFYKNSCDGDANEQLTAFGLAWSPQLNDALFWSNSTDCLSAVDGGVGANGLVFRTVTTTSGTVNQATIDERQLLGQIINDTSTQCDTGASGTVYICVTQNVPINSGYIYSTTSISWYMLFTYNMNPPPAPTGSCGTLGNSVCTTPGESVVRLDWSYDSSSITPDHFLIYYRQDPLLVPDSDNNCVLPGTSGLQTPGLFDGLDGGDDAGANAGICNGCAQNADCLGNNLCVFDQFNVPYCGLNCGVSGSVCPVGFDCLNEDSVDGSLSGQVCVPPNDTCLPPPDAGQASPPDAGPLIPGLCGECSQNADCGGNNLCVGDQNATPYCGTDCFTTQGVCPGGFTCQVEQSIGSGTSGQVCVPPGNACYPAGTLCGTCAFNSDCGGQNLCLSTDAGNYCGMDCSDAGQIVCPLGTTCTTATSVAGQTGTQCALPAGASCYNPNAASVPDGGPDAGALDSGYVYTDAGQIDTTGWNTLQINGQFAATATVNGLTNQLCYDFTVQAIATDGTTGYLSNLVTAAPFESQDWWRLYKAQGGQDNGGWHCQSGGGALTLASLALVLLFSRGASRKRSSSGGGVVG